MQLTDQLMDTIFLPQNQGIGQSLGADHQGGYEEVSVVKRGSQSAHVQVSAVHAFFVAVFNVSVFFVRAVKHSNGSLNLWRLNNIALG